MIEDFHDMLGRGLLIGGAGLGYLWYLLNKKSPETATALKREVARKGITMLFRLFK